VNFRFQIDDFNYWYNNLAVGPQFVDPDNNDLKLQSTLPMVEAGTFLTTTTSSGSGTTFTVNDARYFMDGWGIVDGDTIQLQGQTQTAKITNISGNTITVDTSLTWASGQGVSLAEALDIIKLGFYMGGGA